jgi:hypothetical protein
MKKLYMQSKDEKWMWNAARHRRMEENQVESNMGSAIRLPMYTHVLRR